MSNDKVTLWDLERAVAAEVLERRLELLDESDASDILHEIADSHIPIYYTDLANCLANDTSLAEPEDWCLPEKPTIWQILQWAIYERLNQAAHQAFAELEPVEEVTEEVQS